MRNILTLTVALALLIGSASAQSKGNMFSRLGDGTGLISTNGLTVAGSVTATMDISSGRTLGYNYGQLTNNGNDAVFKILNSNAAFSVVGSDFVQILKADRGNQGIMVGLATVGLNPSASLHVSGTSILNSKTTIGANVAPTSTLDVYGTVSATNLYLVPQATTPTTNGTIRLAMTTSGTLCYLSNTTWVEVGQKTTACSYSPSR